jgi:hypothetical protein
LQRKTLGRRGGGREGGKKELDVWFGQFSLSCMKNFRREGGERGEGGKSNVWFGQFVVLQRKTLGRRVLRPFGELLGFVVKIYVRVENKSTSVTQVSK